MRQNRLCGDKVTLKTQEGKGGRLGDPEGKVEWKNQSSREYICHGSLGGQE